MLKFRPLDVSDLELVRTWRMKPRVTRFMKTDPVITEDAQLDWFQSSKDEHYMACADGKNIGLLTLCKPALGVGSYGFYIGDDEFVALGGFVPAFVTTHLFRPYSGVDKIEIEVERGNLNVIKLHERLGFKFTESYPLQKGDTLLEICKFELKRSKWNCKQTKLYAAFV